LRRGRILIAEGYRVFDQCFEKAGLLCRTTPVAELRTVVSGIGRLTGILERAPAV
jgi:hypothetical protein